MELEVYFVDSFTSKVFGGNPAGVVFHEHNIEHDLMQKIAAENNLSETAFVHTSNNNRIRFFTPELEVELCGHATLASAFTYFNFLVRCSFVACEYKKKRMATSCNSN